MSRSLPFLRPSDRVQAEDWLTRSRGETLGASALAWDYSTTVGLNRTVEVDVAGVLSDCQLTSDAGLVLCVRVWTTRSQLRSLVVRHPVVELGPAPVRCNLAADVDGQGLGGTLQVQTSLELGSATTGDHPFSPRRQGTVLWADTVAVPLEGNAGLLPVSPVSFTDHPRLPDAAAWYVSLDFGDWSAAAMGALLVLVNTDLSAVSDALAAVDDDATANVLWSALGVDIVVDVLSKAMQDAAFPVHADSPVSVEEEALTVAGLVTSLIRAHLQRPTETDTEAFSRLRDLRMQDPSMFRAEVQRSLAFAAGAAT